MKERLDYIIFYGFSRKYSSRSKTNSIIKSIDFIEKRAKDKQQIH